MTINYERLGRAVSFYKDLGYKYVEAPWLVSMAATSVTCADPGLVFSTIDIDLTDRGPVRLDLVGSAEQGFVQMLKDGTLQPGKYVACGPCFRCEPVRDEQHLTTFMKVELIHVINGVTSKADVMALMKDAWCYMDTESKSNHGDVVMRPLPIDSECTRYTTSNDLVDLELNGVEIGSYGRRSFGIFGDLSWVFGTGLAEPRFGYALTVGK